MTVILIRYESTDHGTFGTINLNGLHYFTLELPWLDNKSNVSCIPDGEYTCRLTYSPRFKTKMYLVEGVQDRQGIRFHSANLAGDKSKGFRAQLNGCIAIGKLRGIIDGQKAILLSKSAMREFEKQMQGKPFKLIVRSHDRNHT